MSRAIRIVVTVFLACICQTDLAKYIRIAGIAPDMLTVFLVLLTGYTGAYGGFCAGSLLAMLYDASVGYVLAINLVCYAFIGWAAPMLRSAMNKKLSKVKHKSYLELMLICFFLTLMREIVYIGYLFLALFIWVFVKKVHRNIGYKYRCGHCGEKLKEKGVCPHCGAINE